MSKVALYQPTIIRGGRLSVLSDMIYSLNTIGITPSLVTAKMGLSRSEMDNIYGSALSFDVLELANAARVRGILRAAALSRLAKPHLSAFDVVVNTSNDVHFVPSHPNLISYVFFSRAVRAQLRNRLHGFGDNRSDLRWRTLRVAYQSKKVPDQRIIYMTDFTRRMMTEHWPESVELTTDAGTIYPAVVEVDNPVPFERNRLDNRQIVTAGRFAQDKRQLDQISLARQMTDYQFKIAGFGHSEEYVQRCREAAVGLKNVDLMVNAPFDDLERAFRTSGYFLHSLVNEPFGLTAVRAIASGALPIVHDSGGQGETVTDSRLRYQSLTEVPAQIQALEQLGTPELLALSESLQTHARANFSRGIFSQMFLKVIQN